MATSQLEVFHAGKRIDSHDHKTGNRGLPECESTACRSVHKVAAAFFPSRPTVSDSVRWQLASTLNRLSWLRWTVRSFDVWHVNACILLVAPMDDDLSHGHAEDGRLDTIRWRSMVQTRGQVGRVATSDARRPRATAACRNVDKLNRRECVR